ncbi:MAG: alpha/beta fold hydrolase [Polyangiaceae bacterium]
MLKERIAALQKRYVTLEDGRYGHLVGHGDPSSIRGEGKKGSGGVLALHGFAGTPNEVRVVTEAAARCGLSSRAPRLPGHDSDVRHLLPMGWADWIAAAKDALFELADTTGRRVVVAGLSLGSLLATDLAVHHGDRIAGLIVLANATRLRFPSPSLVLGLCDLVRPLRNAFYVPKEGADIQDVDVRRDHLTYDVTPVQSAVEVLRAGRRVRRELGRVTCPTLVVHGALDRVCPVENAERFARALGTRDVEVAVMPHSGHIVSADRDRAEVARLIEQFLEKAAARM